MTAAYVIVSGVTADEANAAGLVIVEELVNGANRVPVFGRYRNDAAPDVALAPVLKGKRSVRPR